MKVFGVTGWKNAGKTGLMERLVAEITKRGFSVSTVKHAHHAFDVDHEGRDSYRHRVAGAHEVMLASGVRIAQMSELRGSAEPPLSDLLARLKPVDLVLIEGYKREPHPKIEAFREVAGHDLMAPQDGTIAAVAADIALEVDLPVFDLDDTARITEFVLRQVGLIAEAQPTSNLKPPPLKNDCFALPPGVNWTPVDEALEALRTRLTTVVGRETVPLELACGRVLAADLVAKRSNPPLPNTAVDGYGFAGAVPEGEAVFPLIAGRSAAGVPYQGRVPDGHAIRVLTGAALPDGVDTVVLEEDCAISETQIAFNGPVKHKSNTRKAGEDVAEGDIALSKGRVLTPADLALAAAVGFGELPVFLPLRVGVLSTGDELVEPGQEAGVGQIFDANRPMLLSAIARFGYKAVDLGRVADSRVALTDQLKNAAAKVDVILTSGGASAGDEDHVSALLRESGALAEWRIALKPGRPLALGIWDGVPVFGLPGNPVAAFVCTLIFARPALSVLAGSDWRVPDYFDVPAAFSKRKKPGRREYLRARMRGGRVEVFKSEGSGRVSGLSWAEGLVELGDEGREISEGDLVRFYPYGSFGL
ncbi:bifunctional molybdopterin-guanine dinucleotide biosynthesis adaptor protein MobB/molybdopterin molybdotransferase MoeA [Pelagimonas varians]|uniref:Molybdopterin molybdenumtransferase n=1 Tax=Pelagimonas varians TaxID=696760 RepID=A0A238L283_9RHOB|nr:bifunctional molybdopterin-guanine dinucleotide biosynthesis adaptor protein MobB/molybdopterin molybdotransferase MoeA [Pelagimonas varians]PYG26875.1 molybdopterin molybdotransferase [Pelagimonas varians]SMX48931.1 Molybdopterin molybdenumtransferase [Pelagimonas varians]